MTTFIIVAILMVATALALILWPLLRPAHRTTVERRVANLAVYKDQFADLDADLARGSISQEQHAEAKAELERRLLEDARSDAPAAPAAAPQVRFKTAVVLAGLVPIVAGVLYVRLGAPDAFSPLATAVQDQHQLSGEQVEQMVAKLAARLEKEPDNIDGWVILARTYYTQRRFDDAAGAYERLTKLLPNEPDLYADYADALAMAQGRKIAGKPMELVKKALELDPNQWKALAMAGTEAFDRKDYKAAITYWERLKASAGPDAPIGQQIQGSIDEARRLAGLPPSAPVEPVAATKPAPAAPAGASAKADAPPAAGAKTVSGTVALDKGLASKAKPDDAVFVFARPADGSKMPIALTRAQVKDLPLKFTLDDTAAMNPQVKLSGYQEVILVARVSKSGSAMAGSGDFEGMSKPVKVGASGVEVTIDKTLP